ncbi:MAG TPA: 30S ribosomal protein S20 [Firmicutes bacterium]|nr:30S ribosomal protein S20 [Bacillota bacterium]
MPVIKSARKRARTALKRRERNKAVKSRIKTSIKNFLNAEGVEAKGQALRVAASQADRAANKGIIHRNKAARIKSRLAKRLNQTTSA